MNDLPVEVLALSIGLLVIALAVLFVTQIGTRTADFGAPGLGSPIILHLDAPNKLGDTSVVCHAHSYPVGYGAPLSCWGGQTCASYATLEDAKAGRGVPWTGPCPADWVRSHGG